MTKTVSRTTIPPRSNDGPVEKKRLLHQKMRAFNTDMSDFARLFQRVVLKGDEAHAAQLKSIIKETNQRIVSLLEDIEK